MNQQWRQDYWLYVGLFIPIFLVTLDIGWASLDQLQIVREVYIGEETGSIEDITHIVEGGLLLADGVNPLSAGSEYGGGPIKYFVFALLYLIFDPTYGEAVKIGSLFVALLYFVVIPGMLTLYVAKTNGRLAALLTVGAFFLIRRGLLRLGTPILPDSLSIIGPANYIGALWQQTVALPLAFSMLFLVGTIVDREKTISWFRSVTAGLLIGLTGGMQYIVGFTTAVIVAIALLINKKFYDLLLIGSIGALFVPIILVFPSSGNQAMNHISLLWEFGFLISPRVLVFLCYIGLMVRYSGERLSQNYVFESAIAGSTLITLFYPGYVGWIATNITDAVLIAGAVCGTVNVVKTTEYRSLVELGEDYPLTRNRALVGGSGVGILVAVGLFLAVPT
jgi:hypothetical protein